VPFGKENGGNYRARPPFHIDPTALAFVTPKVIAARTARSPAKTPGARSEKAGACRCDAASVEAQFRNDARGSGKATWDDAALLEHSSPEITREIYLHAIQKSRAAPYVERLVFGPTLTPVAELDKSTARTVKERMKLVGARGFEPRTPCAQGRCATRLRYAPTVIDYKCDST
jgi:hypothetical protein